METSRVKKTLLNARVNLIFYFLSLALSFFSRKIFLDCLGADFIGLTGTLQNMLGFLNLAELGIGEAIGYLLYKPLFDQDRTKINEIISVMGYLYRWIGLIILGSGCILACFLPLIFPASDTGFHLPIIYFAYFSFLASSLIGYFINYRQNLLAADQRNYVVTAYYQSIVIIKIIIQLVSAYYTRSYYLWVGIELTFGVVYSIILNWKINQTYPWLKTNIRTGKSLYKHYPEVMTKTRQLFFHKIGGIVQFQLAPVLIYTFGSLFLVAAYQSYQIITVKVSGLINNVLGSARASIGNLIAEGKKNKTISVYWELFSLKFYISGFAIMGVYFMINPFIALWLGLEYILPNNILYLILIIMFIGLYRGVNDDFIYGFGLFWDVWCPVIEAGINIIVAVIMGYFYGLFGVLMGNVVSLTVIICLWRPYLLFHWGFKTSVYIYWKGFLKLLCLTILPVVGMVFLNKRIPINPFESFSKLILYGLIVTAIYIVITYPLMSRFTSGLNRINDKIKNIFVLRKF